MIVQQSTRRQACTRPAQGLHKATSCTIVSFNAHDPPVKEKPKGGFQRGQRCKDRVHWATGSRANQALQFYQGWDRPGFSIWWSSGLQSRLTDLVRPEARSWLAGRWTLLRVRVPYQYSTNHSTLCKRSSERASRSIFMLGQGLSGVHLVIR